MIFLWPRWSSTWWRLFFPFSATLPPWVTAGCFCTLDPSCVKENLESHFWDHHLAVDNGVSFDFYVFFIEGRSKCRKTRRPQSEDLLPHFQLVSAKILISIIRWHHLVHHKHILKYNYNNFHHGYVITSFSTLWIYSEL